MSVESRSSSTVVPFTSRVPGSPPSHIAFGRREHRVTLPKRCNPFFGELPSYPLEKPGLWRRTLHWLCLRKDLPYDRYLPSFGSRDRTLVEDDANLYLSRQGRTCERHPY